MIGTWCLFACGALSGALMYSYIYTDYCGVYVEHVCSAVVVAWSILWFNSSVEAKVNDVIYG